MYYLMYIFHLIFRYQTSIACTFLNNGHLGKLLLGYCEWYSHTNCNYSASNHSLYRLCDRITYLTFLVPDLR